MKMKKNILKKDKEYRRNQLLRGSFSVVVSCIVIAIVIAANYLVSKIPSKYTKYDASSIELYTLSEQSKQIASSINTDVTIYLLAENGSEDPTLTELIKQYQAYGSKIDFECIDTGLYPSFASEYTEDELNQNSLIVKGEYRSAVIDYTEIYVESYSNELYYYYDLEPDVMDFEGESKITTALDYVSNENIPVIYTLTGHGEGEFSDAVLELISGENIEIKELSLLSSETVPEDASCVIINAPTEDLSDKEYEKILAYTENGGNIILFTGYEYSSLGNISLLAKKYGAEAADGLVIEGDSSYHYSEYSYFLLPNIDEHEITSPFAEDYYVLAPLCHGVKQCEGISDNLTVSPLLTTSDSSYAKGVDKLDSLMQADGDEEGPFYIGVASELTDDSGNSSKFVWVSTEELLADEINQQYVLANYDLFMNSVNWMCEKEDAISIRSKSLNAEMIVVDEKTAFSLGSVMILIIPTVCVVTGIAIWNKRKKR